MKYGLLSYATRNLGDDIQSIAARRFLPRIDAYPDRDAIDAPIEDGPVKLILNCWLTNRPDRWPPAPGLLPLLVSTHISRREWQPGVSTVDTLASGAGLDFLRAHQPIGCRDYVTLDLMRARGLDSYFSGCLTLTLQNLWQERSDVTYCVDVRPPVHDYVERQVEGPVVALTHKIGVGEQRDIRFALAELRLRQYATARLVVTTRLHVAMPCLALGTPVVLVLKKPRNDRFSGLAELTRHYNERDLLEGRADIDWRDPAPNPTTFRPLRDALIERCEAFVAG